MAKDVNYKLLENNEGVLKMFIEETKEIDLSSVIGNIVKLRGEYQKAMTQIYQMSVILEEYDAQHAAQNDFLEYVGNELGEKYVMPELKSPFNSDEILKIVEDFSKAETARRAKTMEDVNENVNENAK